MNPGSVKPAIIALIGIIVAAIITAIVGPIVVDRYKNKPVPANTSNSELDYRKTRTFEINSNGYRANITVDFLKPYRGTSPQPIAYPDKGKTKLVMPYQSDDTLVIPFQIYLEITAGSGEKNIHYYLQHDKCYFNNYINNWSMWDTEKDNILSWYKTPALSNKLSIGDDLYSYGYIAIPSFYDSANPNGNFEVIYEDLNISFGFDSLDTLELENYYHTCYFDLKEVLEELL